MSIDLPADLLKYSEVHTIRATYGYIVWRYGTGGNVELLHIRSTEPGKGRELLQAMLTRVLADPPYGGKGTVFGFTRVSNTAAQDWYSRMGFGMTEVYGVYAEGSAVCFSAPFHTLCWQHGLTPPEITGRE